MNIVVITKIPKQGEDGNQSDRVVVAYKGKLYLENTIPSDAVPENGSSLVGFANDRVFELGEILILDNDGRELSGHGRKPSKWMVEHQSCETLEEAIKLTEQLKESE